MQDARIRWALAGLCLLCLGGSAAMLIAGRRAAPPIVITTPPGAGSVPPALPAPAGAPPAVGPAASSDSRPQPPAAPLVSAASSPDRIYVHVAGAVRHPSLYLLPAGSRVMQAIKAAGGPAARADLDAVNLAEKVQDGEKVYVPAKTWSADGASSSLMSQAMPAPAGNTLSGGSTTAVSAMSPAGPSGPGPGSRGGARAQKLLSPDQGQIDLNTASAEDLERLPGVGPAMAARILAYRQQTGGFQSIQQLIEVGGIGPKKFAKLAPFVKTQ